MVNASTIRNDAFIADTEIDCSTDKRVVHVERVSGCFLYIIMKHVAYIGSCVAAVKISTMARPTRK